MVVESGDPVYLLVPYEFRDGFDQAGLIHQKRKLCYKNFRLSARLRLDAGDSPDCDLSPSGSVGLLDAVTAENGGAGRKIRPLDDLHNVFDRSIRFSGHPIVNHPYTGVNHLTQIMRRHIGCHPDGNSCCPVDQQIGNPRREHHRFLFRLIEVRNEINGVFVDIRQHLHGDSGQSGFRVTHRGRRVPVDRTEIAVSVHQRIMKRPVLRHIDQRAVNRRISVRMILTHRIADNTGALPVRLVRSVIELNHGPQHAALHRLQAVPDIRKSP